jgi:ubiquinone/menaquinone biosynthesis C-methylase UbiE
VDSCRLTAGNIETGRRVLSWRIGMDRVELVAVLKDIDRRADPNWVRSLDERKREELEFHNSARDKDIAQDELSEDHDTLHGNRKYYETTHLSREYMSAWLARHVPGKVFLDYACGDGNQVVQAAALGADLAVGIDISDLSLTYAREHAREAGVEEKCIFIHGDCEETGLPAAVVDVVLCSGMLHHLNLDLALPELHRIMKEGGVALAVEALNHNPLIKMYRRATPEMRTAWERAHILEVRDLKRASNLFDVGEIRYWHLFSLFAVFCRRWPMVFDAALNVLDCLDRLLLRVPVLRAMSWQFSCELRAK